MPPTGPRITCGLTMTLVSTIIPGTTVPCYIQTKYVCLHSLCILGILLDRIFLDRATILFYCCHLMILYQNAFKNDTYMFITWICAKHNDGIS